MDKVDQFGYLKSKYQKSPLSFLPRDNHVYKLAPYEPISEKQYNDLVKRFAHIDYSKILTYEKRDETELKKELACVAGVCEIV